MLHAVRARERDDARRLLGAALALLMVFRLLLGPALLSSPEPGLIPLCAGTNIVYVARDGIPGRQAPEVSAPCPYFGFAAAPALPGEPVSPPQATIFSGHRSPAIPALPGQARRAGYSSRAPPSQA